MLTKHEPSAQPVLEAVLAARQDLSWAEASVVRILIAPGPSGRQHFEQAATVLKSGPGGRRRKMAVGPEHRATAPSAHHESS